MESGLQYGLNKMSLFLTHIYDNTLSLCNIEHASYRRQKTHTQISHLCTHIVTCEHNFFKLKHFLLPKKKKKKKLLNTNKKLKEKNT